MKKKTQELEKFKFVLDYKIKDLKREIIPQETEIQELKNETQRLDEDLKQFNKSNSGLGLIVDDHRQRQTTLQEANKKARTLIRRNEVYISQYKNAIYWVAQQIDNPHQLQQEFSKHMAPYIDLT